MPWRTDRRRGAGSSLAERASCVSTLLGRVLMTTLCNWLALGQGECQKFVPGEHLPRRDMLILRGSQRAHGHHAHPSRQAWDMPNGSGLAQRDMLILRARRGTCPPGIPGCADHGLAPGGYSPARSSKSTSSPSSSSPSRPASFRCRYISTAAGGGQQDACDEEDDAAEPGPGISVADGPRLVGGVVDILAVDRIDGGVEGIEEEDNHQQGDAHDGDHRAGDQRRPGVAGQPVRALALLPGPVAAGRRPVPASPAVLPGRVR